jgi:hypothetical protein
MDDTIADQQVWDGDAGSVDVDGAVNDADVQLSAILCSQGCVLERCAVRNAVFNDMVAKRVGEVLGGQVGEDTANSIESVVVGGEDGDIPQRSDRFRKVGTFNGTGSSGEVGVRQGVGHVHGDGKDSVNDVDDTAREVKVLRRVSIPSGYMESASPMRDSRP